MKENRFTPAVAASGGSDLRGARMAGTESFGTAVCATDADGGASSATSRRARAPDPREGTGELVGSLREGIAHSRTSRHPAARLTGMTPDPRCPPVTPQPSRLV